MAENLIFDWKGTDRAGKKVSGETKGANVTLVKAKLRKQGINASSVKKRSKPLFSFGGKKIGPADIPWRFRRVIRYSKTAMRTMITVEMMIARVSRTLLRRLLPIIVPSQHQRLCKQSWQMAKVRITTSN